MKNKILLYYPKDYTDIKKITEPLSLLALSSMLIEKSYEPIIIDGRLYKDPIEEIKKYLDDIICFGVTTFTGIQIKDAVNTSKFIKNYNKNIPIVFGGWHVSILPEQSIINDYIDYVVVGQGEISFLELINHIKINGLMSCKIKGVYSKKNGQIVFGGKREIESLDNFPPISRAFHLIDLNNYKGRQESSDEVFASFRTSQGCPFRCSFCASPVVFKRKISVLSPEKVVDEIEYLVKNFGVKHIGFVDELLIFNEKRINKICNLILEKKINIKWNGTVRIGTVAKMSEETLQLMKKSGCRILHPGVEAPTQELLDFICKDEKIENLFVCAEKLSKVGIKGLYSFIVCFPEEPKDTIMRTFDIIRKLKIIDPDNIMPVNFYTPYPGNPLYNLSLKKGFKEPKDLNEWSDFNTRFGNVPWITDEKRDIVMRMDKYYLPAAYPSEIMKKKMQEGKMKYVYRIFNRIAKWRIEHRNFRFLIDWKILLTYWKFWGKNKEKYQFLPNIHFRW